MEFRCTTSIDTLPMFSDKVFVTATPKLLNSYAVSFARHQFKEGIGVFLLFFLKHVLGVTIS